MTTDLRMTGADQLGRLAADLKHADKDIRKEMLRGLRTATRPAVEAVALSARARLPRRGGLADKVAAERAVSRTTTGVRSAGVRITRKRGRSFEETGRLRHPVYGNRDVWVEQHVDTDWFTRPLEQLEPTVQVAMLRVLTDIERKLAREH